jgi:PEP-CTERM motif
MSLFSKTTLSRLAAETLVASSALVCSLTAQAADAVTNVTNYGLVTLPYTQGFGRAEAPSSPNYFVNDYGFSIGTSGSFSSAVVSIDLFNILQISNLSISLIQGAAWSGSVPSPLSSGDVATRLANTLAFDNTGVINITPFTLNPGSYFLQVRGLASGSAGGSYGGNLNIAAVPEPEGVLLALAGVGFLAFSLRRARRG